MSSYDEPPVGAGELEDIAHRLRVRKLVGIAAAVVLLVFMTLYVVGSINQNNSNNHTGQVVNLSNCHTQYSSLLGVPQQTRANANDTVNSLNATLSSELGEALILEVNGQKPSQAIVDQYATTRAALVVAQQKLAKAISVVEHDPTLNEAAMNGFTFNGHKYPPCASQ